MSDATTKKDAERTLKWYLKQTWIWALLIAGLWLLVPTAQFFWFSESDQTNSGLIGDSFGSVNALFSAFAFAGVIVTIWMQSDELRLQRDELRMTRDEMELQRGEMEENRKVQEVHSKALNRQAYIQLMAARIQGHSTFATTNFKESQRSLEQLLRHMDNISPKEAPRDLDRAGEARTGPDIMGEGPSGPTE